MSRAGVDRATVELALATAFLGLCLMLAACGTVTPASSPDGAAAAGGRNQATGGAGGTAGTDAGGASGGAAGVAETHDAGAELGLEAPPAGPPPCPGATGTADAQRCGDKDGVRCATGCADTSGHAHADGCLEPGAPWTGGIPVLCVASCGDCP